MESSRILGIDPGEVRVGASISDELGLLAHPLETIPAPTAVTRIAEIVGEKHIRAVVVGVPRNMDGSFGPAAEKARDFIRRLETALSCRIIPWDERLTTVSARRALREAGIKEKKQRAFIDQAAAQVLLQSWLDAQQ